jgi:hypothetical protein
MRSPVFAEAARLNPANPMNAVMRATALIHQAAGTTEDRYLQKNPQLKNSEALQNEIKRLREKSGAAKTKP